MKQTDIFLEIRDWQNDYMDMELYQQLYFKLRSGDPGIARTLELKNELNNKLI